MKYLVWIIIIIVLLVLFWPGQSIEGFWGWKPRRWWRRRWGRRGPFGPGPGFGYRPWWHRWWY